MLGAISDMSDDESDVSSESGESSESAESSEGDESSESDESSEDPVMMGASGPLTIPPFVGTSFVVSVAKRSSKWPPRTRVQTQTHSQSRTSSPSRS
jgi:hypothetical protein